MEVSTIKPSVRVVAPFVIGLFRIVLNNEFSGERFQMDFDGMIAFVI